MNELLTMGVCLLVSVSVQVYVSGCACVLVRVHVCKWES